ncbi:MAG: hypothetical protein JJT94_01650 [Bernardetiaceae bacterium]|nr:hypothetical protein [Bernardetiaceae bacterium]
MKKYIIFCLLYFLSLSYTSAQIHLKGFESQVNWLCYSQDGSQMFAFGSNWIERDGKRRLGRQIIIWDINTQNILQTQEVGHLDKVKIEGHDFLGVLSGSYISPDKKKVCIVGTQYQSRTAKSEYRTVLHFHDIATNTTESIGLKANIQVQKLKFHPTNPDLLGLIAMDENFNFVALTYNLKTQTIAHTLLQGKGSLIPLFIDFSTDGNRTYVSYGSGSYTGGFHVYQTTNGKQIKQIALKDQPHYFFEWNNQLIVTCLKQTIFYKLDNFIAVATMPHSIGAIYAKNDIGLIVPNGESNAQKVQFVSLKSRQKTKLLLDDFIGGAQFSPSGKQVAVINFKDRKEESLATPSISIFDVE